MLLNRGDFTTHKTFLFRVSIDDNALAISYLEGYIRLS